MVSPRGQHVQRQEDLQVCEWLVCVCVCVCVCVFYRAGQLDTFHFYQVNLTGDRLFI